MFLVSQCRFPVIISTFSLNSAVWCLLPLRAGHQHAGSLDQPALSVGGRHMMSAPPAKPPSEESASALATKVSAPPAEASPEELLGTLGSKEGRVRALVRRSADWPRRGTTFLDVTPLLCDASALAACVDALAQRYKSTVTHVAGIDARGFPLGCAGTPLSLRVRARAQRHAGD